MKTFGKSGLSRAGFAKLRMGPCLNRKLGLIHFCGIFFKFVCANSLYCGGPKTLLTDQHLLRTNLFFVTETSELRLAGLFTDCCMFLFRIRLLYVSVYLCLFQDLLCVVATDSGGDVSE